MSIEEREKLVQEILKDLNTKLYYRMNQKKPYFLVMDDSKELTEKEAAAIADVLDLTVEVVK